MLLAKALINEPELLLLDEPTASLDPDTADQLRGHLERYQARTHATVLLASHNMGEVERLAHHVLMLRQGRLVDQGSPAELLARYGRDDLEDVFLDIARDRRRPEPRRMTPARRPCAASGRCSTATPTCCSAPGRACSTSIYWPTVQMVLWGFITQFLVGQSGWVAQAAGVFLSAVLLWDTLFRGQLGVSMCFLEEMYARHLGHLFVSPLRPGELVVANFLVSLMRVLIGVGGAAILAVPIFHFSLIGTLGWAILPFFAVMMLFGWAIGLIIAGLVIRLGLGAESLAWAAIFFIQPFSAVYYPVDTLPAAVRWIAYLLPSAPVFEGMRAVLVENRFDWALFGQAVAVLAVWLVVGGIAFTLLFRSARRRGLLLQTGE